MSDERKILKLQPELKAYARAVADDVDIADDLVQEATVRALAHDKAPSAEKDLRHWLFRVIRNLYVDSKRRMKVRTEYSVSFKRLYDEQPIFDDGPLTNILLRQALESLSSEHREILFLVDIMGMSYAEAADLTGVAKGTVMSRLSRARRALLEQLDQSNVTPIDKKPSRKR